MRIFLCYIVKQACSFSSSSHCTLFKLENHYGFIQSTKFFKFLFELPPYLTLLVSDLTTQKNGLLENSSSIAPSCNRACSMTVKLSKAASITELAGCRWSQFKQVESSGLKDPAKYPTQLLLLARSGPIYRKNIWSKSIGWRLQVQELSCRTASLQFSLLCCSFSYC